MPDPRNRRDPRRTASIILEGRLRTEALAADLGVGVRTIDRYASQGLPFIVVGGARWFSIAETRRWFETTKRVARNAA